MTPGGGRRCRSPSPATSAISVNGQGSLSFYGPAETSLGVSGDWTSYSATATGSVTITLTTDGLSLNGQTLPAGTYTITTSSATLTGSGAEHVARLRRLGLDHRDRRHGQPRARDRQLSVGGNPLDPDDGRHADGLHRHASPSRPTATAPIQSR